MTAGGSTPTTTVLFVLGFFSAGIFDRNVIVLSRIPGFQTPNRNMFLVGSGDGCSGGNISVVCSCP